MGLRLERKLAAPVTCMKCDWIGATGDLGADRGQDGSPFRCPACKGGWCIKWIEAPGTTTVQ